VEPAGKVAAGTSGFVVDGRQNQSFKAVNKLLAKGASIERVDQAQGALHPGDFIVAAKTDVAQVAKETGVNFLALNAAPKAGSTHPVKALRVGLRQRYSGGNIDEGWTRWLIEDFAFPYTSLMDADIKKGNLNEKYDVIIIPDDPMAMIVGAAAAGPGRGGEAAVVDSVRRRIILLSTVLGSGMRA